VVTKRQAELMRRINSDDTMTNEDNTDNDSGREGTPERQKRGCMGVKRIACDDCGHTIKDRLVCLITSERNKGRAPEADRIGDMLCERCVTNKREALRVHVVTRRQVEQIRRLDSDDKTNEEDDVDTDSESEGIAEKYKRGRTREGQSLAEESEPDIPVPREKTRSQSRRA